MGHLILPVEYSLWAGHLAQPLNLNATEEESEAYRGACLASIAAKIQGSDRLSGEPEMLYLG